MRAKHLSRTIEEDTEGEWLYQIKMCSACGHVFGFMSDGSDCGRPQCDGSVRPLARYVDPDAPDRLEIMAVIAELERAIPKAKEDGRRREKNVMQDCAERLEDSL